MRGTSAINPVTYQLLKCHFMLVLISFHMKKCLFNLSSPCSDGLGYMLKLKNEADFFLERVPKLFIYCFTAQVLKVCRTPGPTACSRTNMLQLAKVCLKRRKNSMTRPRQPQTCSHPICARTLTEVHQAVRYFLLSIFHVSISIGTLESDSLYNSKHPK